MREYVLKVLCKAKSVGGCREQTENCVKDVLRRNRLAVRGAQSCDECCRNIRRVDIWSSVMQREGITAIAAAKGVIIRKKAIAPYRWSRAGAVW
jgi:hypothetical protein